jgi:hypothetical protein
MILLPGYRSMDENGEVGGDFKMLLAPVPRQYLAAEPPTDDDTEQPAPSGPAPQAEGPTAVEGVLKTPHYVIETVVGNQLDAGWWANREVVERLRVRSEKVIHTLDLRVKDAEKLGVPLIKIERMSIRTLGDYRPQADGYAIIGTIVINEERLRTLKPFMEMALMLTLLVRARQHQLGGDGRLDREGRELMKSKGLVVTEKGKITITPDGAFRRFLESETIEVPVASEFPQPVRVGKTTNQLWSCLCQKTRVGTREFFANCPKCHEPFRPGDHVGKRFVS